MIPCNVIKSLISKQKLQNCIGVGNYWKGMKTPLIIHRRERDRERSKNYDLEEEYKLKTNLE